MIWIERYPPERDLCGEDDRVTFAPWRLRLTWPGGVRRRTRGTPEWTPRTRAPVMVLLGREPGAADARCAHGCAWVIGIADRERKGARDMDGQVIVHPNDGERAMALRCVAAAVAHALTHGVPPEGIERMVARVLRMGAAPAFDLDESLCGCASCRALLVLRRFREARGGTAGGV